ncbi:conserved Plasmodium membrane protein, unknown function [Plasmodium gallinaceum]|uniref:Uncharacterized protein n=1 Tax=Plasmodium gallinaceum TaxID=5849 RepID=A0A1J1GRM2_PLAGA|nr:conserved Plasmodium membrane protein, unknown function [Plasmodium gallinaceum]CRG95074.1 conserved Plasmodium membrane protein, unknown function [Plasmodium gallinaceum]
MDKLYGDYDKIVEKYKNNTLYKRRNEKDGNNKREVKEKSNLDKKKEKDLSKKETNKKDKKISDKKLKKENFLLSENSHNKFGNNDSSNENKEHLLKNKRVEHNLRDRSYNQYKIRKKLSIEINKKIFSDSENMHIDDKSFLNDNLPVDINNLIIKKRKNKNGDQKIKQILNKKDKMKFMVNFLYVLYYIFFFFHYIIDLQVNKIYNIVINTFIIIILSVLLCYIHFLKTKNKKLKKIIFYISAYVNLLYCLYIFNTFIYWINVYLNFTLSKKLYLKYRTLYKNVSFIFSYFNFDEIFFFLLIFYGLFFFTSSLLTITLFYYIYNFINYSF